MAEKRKNSRKKTDAKDRKINQILTLVGLAIAAVFFIVSIIFVVMLHYVDLIPLKYKVLVAVILLLCTIALVITQRWKIGGIITKVVAVLLCVVLIVGCVYLGYTRGAIGRMAGGNKQVETISIYVMESDKAEKLEDVNGYTCGKISNIDSDNTQKVIDDISQNKGVNLTYKDYTSVTGTVDALLSGEVESVMLNEAYMSMLDDMEGYQDVSSKVRVVYSTDIEYSVKGDVNEDYLSNDDVITLYVSGIDTEGTPSAVSRSDVNILISINTKTHQVIMINTPRDYYVPLSISHGVKDKLTHAGIYGIDCSMDTLEMLYEVNIDYYVRMNFTGFRKIVDALGGVTVHSDYDFVTTHGGKHISVGNNTLNGDEALGFARERYAFSDGDRQRGRNQMEVIKAIFQKMTTTTMLTNYTSILSSISDSMSTNMPYDEIGNLAKMQLDEMPSWDIQSYSVNGTGDYAVPFSMSSSAYVMVPDMNTVNQAKGYLTQLYNNEIVDISDNN